MEPVRAPLGTPPLGAYTFFVLACAITWAMDVPMVLVTLGREPASPLAMALAGLGAFGPTLAALVLAASRRELGEVFGRWRTHVGWIALALVAVPALHLSATLLEVALGGEPAQWFYPPTRPEHVAALVMFSLGEEFGWRGFAYARLAERHGPVVGSLILGVVWALWHFCMWFTADGPPALTTLSLGALELALSSVVLAWMFERGNRSMAVAIAFHASGHLDNTFRAPDSELRLIALRFVVLAIAAALAARSLGAKAARPVLSLTSRA